MALNLSPDKAYRFAQHFVVSGVRQGLSANAIQNNLQSLGLGYRRENLLADIRRYQDVPARMPRLTQQEFTTYLAPNLTIKMPTKGGTRWQYAYTVNAVNLDTGEEVPVTYSIVSPFRLTPELAQAQAMVKIDFAQSNLQPDFSSLDLMGENQFYSELP